MTELPNWFVNDGLDNFIKIVSPEFSHRPCRALQVGAYSGDASVWLASNVLTHPDSVLIDVDTWEGSDEPAHHQMNWQSVEAVYDVKTQPWRQQRKIIKLRGTSDWFFKNNVERYDFIYVDGDHTSYGVIKDAINSYEVLNVNGIIAFDDYGWIGGSSENERPKKAIDAFLDIYSDRVEVLIRSYQCWVRKMK